MSEKTPRLKPSQATSRPAYDPAMAALARRGAELYHPPLTPDQQRNLGQLSITDGVPIIHDAPPEPPDLAA